MTPGATGSGPMKGSGSHYSQAMVDRTPVYDRKYRKKKKKKKYAK